MKDEDDAANMDAEILHALDVARNYVAKSHPTRLSDPEDLAHIVRHASLARWLCELRERRKLGYHPPCPSCQWRERCVTTSAGRVSETWWCTMYEFGDAK